MSFIFSRALVEAFSAANCSDTDASALSSGSPTRSLCLWHDRTMEVSRHSRYGMTCEPLTDDRGEALLTWWRVDFLARTSALPEKAQESPESDPASGPTWRASLAKFDPDTCSWKTVQLSLLGDSELSSVTWPRSGMTADGQCWELPTLGRRIKGTDAGFWPTPVKTDGFAVGWCQTSIERKEAGESRPSGAKIGSGLKYFRPTQRHLVNGYPNPSLTEWLMGWPIKWTDLQPRAMAKSPNVQPQHGECLEAADSSITALKEAA